MRLGCESTSAAPLTYWAWPPMREGCCCWSEEDIVCVCMCDLVVVRIWWFLMGQIALIR